MFSIVAATVSKSVCSIDVISLILADCISSTDLTLTVLWNHIFHASWISCRLCKEANFTMLLNGLSDSLDHESTLLDHFKRLLRASLKTRSCSGSNSWQYQMDHIAPTHFFLPSISVGIRMQRYRNKMLRANTPAL